MTNQEILQEIRALAKGEPCSSQEILPILRQHGCDYLLSRVDDPSLKQQMLLQRSLNSIAVKERYKACTPLFAQSEIPYAVIKGEWKNHLPYGTLHRIASTGERRGMMDVIVDWAFEKTGGNLRGDTHELNLPMQTAFERNGFERCGIIWVEDGTPRIAYHKTK